MRVRNSAMCPNRMTLTPAVSGSLLKPDSRVIVNSPSVNGPSQESFNE